MAEPLGVVKEFFNPHPGFAGAMVSIPSAVRAVARELVGTRLPLAEAVAMISRVTTGIVEVEEDWISLQIRSGGFIHVFRVICFK